MAQAMLIFGDTIRWEHVRIVESASWPRSLAAVSARWQRNPPPAENAVTLWHRIYFSRRLRTDLQGDALQSSDLGWLIHELTHVWQFERQGLRLLFDAILLHLRPGQDPYDYGGKGGLQAATTPPDLNAFNLEQQADIAQDFFLALTTRQDTQAWEPYVLRFRMG
jgi:hypothetical protein